MDWSILEIYKKQTISFVNLWVWLLSLVECLRLIQVAACNSFFHAARFSIVCVYVFICVCVHKTYVCVYMYIIGSFSGGTVVKNPAANARAEGVWVQSLGQEDPLEEETATHSSILAWRIPWTEEPGGLQSTELQESDTTERISVHRFLGPRNQLSNVYPQ